MKLLWQVSALVALALLPVSCRAPISRATECSARAAASAQQGTEGSLDPDARKTSDETLVLPPLRPLPLTPQTALCPDDTIRDVYTAYDLGSRGISRPEITELTICGSAFVSVLEAKWGILDAFDAHDAIKTLELHNREDSWHPLILILEDRYLPSIPCDGNRIFRDPFPREPCHFEFSAVETLTHLKRLPPLRRLLSVALTHKSLEVQKVLYELLGKAGNASLLPRLRAAAMIEEKRTIELCGYPEGQHKKAEDSCSVRWGELPSDCLYLAMARLGDPDARKRLIADGIPKWWAGCAYLTYVGDRRLARLLLPWLASNERRETMPPSKDGQYLRDVAADCARELGVSFEVVRRSEWAPDKPYLPETIENVRVAIEALPPP